ncbi:MAG: cytochrome c oxidase assembly protein [Pseudomonadota bacterium]
MNKTKHNRRLASAVLVAALGMFGFGYALVPLYDIICDITGLNGRTGVVQAQEVEGPDEARWVTVQFLANVNSKLAWDFVPTEPTMQVHPGKIYETVFVARSRASATVVGQAVPSVSPTEAAPHFNKTECFCFTKQALDPGEEREMPVRFVVDRSISNDVSTVTLAYTFFRVENES